MTVIEFRKEKNIKRSSTIFGWIEKGYMPGVKDTVTGIIDIPADMPLPYKSNGRITKISSLKKAFIKAADEGRSVYPQMFPKISTENFKMALADMVSEGDIRICYCSNGAPYLYLVKSKEINTSEIIATTADCIGAAAAVMQAVHAFYLLK
ncbi:MAG: hypothetical protein IIY11_01595 [Clostridia bacterium]|nr:hypothetical protein [Clostridia bacterium]